MPVYTDVDSLFDFGIDIAVGREEKEPEPAVDWILSKFIDPITLRKVELIEPQVRILKEATKRQENGRNVYDTVVWSQPKKSGKTTIAAAIGAWAANELEAPNEIDCLANDQEAAAGRIFENMLPTLSTLGWVVPDSPKSIKRNPICYGPNRSVVKAITTDYKKQAGGNQGVSLWSELWAFDGERLTRLWDELTPPPTRKYGQRWVETYAGFIGQSSLLENYYKRVFKDFDEKEVQEGVNKLWHDLPVYRVADHILVFWDHEHRMPWQTPDYYVKQKEDMRKNAYTRLHENKWVDSTDSFITLEMWEKSLRFHDGRLRGQKATYALDGSKSGASTSLVGTVKEGKCIKTTDVQVWEPEPGKDIDYSKVEKDIVQRWKLGLIRPPLYYDPYQMAKMAQDLRSKGVPCEEFNQGTERTQADTFLEKLYNNEEIFNPNDPKLKKHISGAKVEDKGDNRVRIIKATAKDGKDSIPDVDAAVAQSMSSWKAYHRKSGGWGASGI